MVHALRVLFLASLPLSAFAGDFVQQRRIDRLQNAVLAPCCYTEPVSRHQSEVAVKMRAEIRDWVKQGRSDREILDIYKRRYGTRVLVEPEGAPWWLVHMVPLLVLALGTALVVWLLVRWRAGPSLADAPREVRDLRITELDDE